MLGGTEAVTTIRIFHLPLLVSLASYGTLAMRVPSIESSIYWILWIGYAGLLVGDRRKVRWCAHLAVLPPLLVFLLSAPLVLYNVWAFAVGALYQDSPATILVVGILAVGFSLPSARACLLRLSGDVRWPGHTY